VLWNAIRFIVVLRLFGAFPSVFWSQGKLKLTLFQLVFIYKWFSVLFLMREEMPFFGAFRQVRCCLQHLVKSLGAELGKSARVKPSVGYYRAGPG